MNLVWASVILLGTAGASYLKDGCLVRNGIETTVDTDSSLNFTIRLPISPNAEILLPNQNITHKIKERLGSQDTPNPWSDVQLTFYPRLQFRLDDGPNTPFGGDLQKPPQKVIVKNAEIMTNCPQREPVWYMNTQKTRLNFNLEENDTVIIIPQESNLKVKIKVGRSTWYMCGGGSNKLTLHVEQNGSCPFTERNEYKISFTKGKDTIKMQNANQTLATVNYDEKDEFIIELTEGKLHVVHLPQIQKGDTGPDQKHQADSSNLMMGLFITTLLLLILVVVFIIVLYIRLPTNIKKELLPWTVKTAAQNSLQSAMEKLPDEPPKPPKRPIVPSSSTSSYGSQRLFIQASRQNSNNSNKDQARLNLNIPLNKTQSEKPYDDIFARPCENTSKVQEVRNRPHPPHDPNKRETDYDYISPLEVHEVRPLEVAVLKHENVITGNVTPTEHANKWKSPAHDTEGEYLSIEVPNSSNTGYVPDEMEDPDQGEYLIMNNSNSYHTGYEPTSDEEPIYANLPR